MIYKISPHPSLPKRGKEGEITSDNTGRGEGQTRKGKLKERF
jgi:hypothetical protein